MNFSAGPNLIDVETDGIEGGRKDEQGSLFTLELHPCFLAAKYLVLKCDTFLRQENQKMDGKGPLL